MPVSMICCGPCTVCRTIPRYLSATFAGITLCTGCFVDPDGGVSYQVISGNPNGTFDLTFNIESGGQCAWLGTLSDPVVLRTFSEAEDCTGAFNDTTIDKILLLLTGVGFNRRIVSITSDLAAGFPAFYSLYVDPAFCDLSDTIGSDIDAADCLTVGPVGVFPVGSGGTVDINPLP